MMVIISVLRIFWDGGVALQDVKRERPKNRFALFNL